MTVSETDICNMALSKIGISPINTITNPESEAEKYCYLWYHQSRKHVLRKHTWNFATKSIIPEFDKAVCAYRLPADFVRFASPNNYEIKGNHIYSSDYSEYYQHSSDDSCVINDPRGDHYYYNRCCISYIYDCNNTNLFDVLFIESLALYLASQICYGLTKDLSLENNLFNKFLLSIPEAKSIDSQDSRKLRVYSHKNSSFLNNYPYTRIY